MSFGRERSAYAKARSRAQNIFDGLSSDGGPRDPEEGRNDYLPNPYPRVVIPGKDVEWSQEEEEPPLFMDDLCLSKITSASPETLQLLFSGCPILDDPPYTSEGKSLEDHLGSPPVDVDEIVGNDQWKFDVCAWYQPIHIFGGDYGIFIRIQCIERIAKTIASSVDPSKLAVPLWMAARQCRIAACFGLLFHEFYHHKVEAFGIRLNASKSHFDLHSNKRKLPYIEYQKKVYQVLKKQRSSELLEESLANAFAYRHLNQLTYRRVLQKEIHQVTRACLLAGFKHQPPGYNMASNYLSDFLFSEGERRLQQQVLEGTFRTSQRGQVWCGATEMMRSLQMVKATPTYMVL